MCSNDEGMTLDEAREEILAKDEGIVDKAAEKREEIHEHFEEAERKQDKRDADEVHAKTTKAERTEEAEVKAKSVNEFFEEQ